MQIILSLIHTCEMSSLEVEPVTMAIKSEL